MLSNCGHDEHGGSTGGRAGDQTGREWDVVPWYQYAVGTGWQYCIRHPDRAVGQLIADLAAEAAANDNIGYDQNERYTFWNNLPGAGYHPANITVPCEADCSSGVAAIVKAVGHLTSYSRLAALDPDCYTGNIRRALEALGFEAYSDSKYLTGPDYLLPGDFLLKEGWHICTKLTAGSESDPGEGEDELITEIFRSAYINETFRPPVLRYVGIDKVPVRLAPADSAPQHPRFPFLNKGNGVIVYDRFNTGYVCIEVSAGANTGTNCYIDANYLSKDIP